ncbi:MAG: hypothetical protein V7637_2412 [Mycobacteriales bacterium]
MCGAPAQEAVLDETLPVSVDPATATVIQGRVLRGGEPVPAAYVRLLDGSGDFTAEVISSATGVFRFFAAPGRWTVRALAPGASGEQALDAKLGFTTTDVTLG